MTCDKTSKKAISIKMFKQKYGIYYTAIKLKHLK